jgi:hypothetical protein
MRLNPMDHHQEVISAPQPEIEQSAKPLALQRWTVSLTSLFFIVLQSACSLVMAISGVRVIIGLGALAAATVGAQAPAAGLHRDSVRIPMMILAVGGSLVNLYVIWRIRSLRKRGASQWRQRPVSRKRVLAENAQIAIAILTLILVAAEFLSHLFIFRLVG